MHVIARHPLIHPFSQQKESDMRGTQDETVVDPEIVRSTKIELAKMVEKMLDGGILAIPFLSWDPESRDVRERVAIRRIGTIFGAYQVHTWYWG